ncbi:MAG: S53 family peptidase [Herminiimonas sp.]|nr:S53 family peptidase [Herminiimonas sp.]
MTNFLRRNDGSNRGAFLSALGLATLLSACGAGGGNNNVSAGTDPVAVAAVETANAGGPVASATTVVEMRIATLPDDVATRFAQPAFHAAPVVLDAPDDVDRIDSSASARVAPRTEQVPAALNGISTRQLTLPALEAALRRAAAGAGGGSAAPAALPLATPASVAIYSPAQIRAAYNLPPLPAAGTVLLPAQAAQLGAGQTIYIVDAQHDPNIVAELAAFNHKFGLPGCITGAIVPTTPLPLAAAGEGCELDVVYSTAAGGIAATAPAYDAAWATEIALDVQWAHATAPLARIVLIEAPDGSLKNLLGAVTLANAMGPGVVSMSFGSPEGTWTGSADAAFAAPGMSYLAASGDSGAAVEWPSVSANVLAVGGTTLSYSGTGTRAEAGWSGTGGGISQYVATPYYQTAAVPGLVPAAHRAVADVAFNADPASGQYVATVAPGSTAVGWISVGGTSLATPQWAGIIAIGNAQRALASRPLLGIPHALLYGQIASVPGTYASVFADVTAGADGICAICTARVGYDTLSGLGTPNVDNLLAAIGGASAAIIAPVAPSVLSHTITGRTGIALSFTASVHASNPVTYGLTGAPAGMVIAANGAITWPSPIVGSTPVTVTATDISTGVGGSGTYLVVIASSAVLQAVPVLTPAMISSAPGVALEFSTRARAAGPIAFALSGAPPGMGIGSTGVITWPVPLAGTYTVAVTAKDSRSGLSSVAPFTVVIAAGGPVITAPPIAAVAGTPVQGAIAVADPGARSLRMSISGVPMGMTFMLSGTTIYPIWAHPVAGSYTLDVEVVDALGLTTQRAVPVTITAK